MRTLINMISCIFLLTACTKSLESIPVIGSEPPVQIFPTDTNPPLDTLPTKEPPIVSLPTLEPGETKMPPVDVIVSPFDPKPEDKNLERSTVHLYYIGLVIMESHPVQIGLELQGYLPTPCHSLQVTILPPDQENRIYGEIYAVVDPSVMCVQVIKEFETNVSLGSFLSGHYTVYINGELLGEFDS